MSRVIDDPMMIPHDGSLPAINEPIAIVHKIDGGEGYIVMLPTLDPNMNDPRRFGIMLSDLLDHIAAAYQHVTGRDQRDIRDYIAKVMRDEDRFKAKDPKRAEMRGATKWPTRQ